MAALWAGADECCRVASGDVYSIYFMLSYSFMTTSDRNDLMPAQQEKLEWVTPNMTLMESHTTDGKNKLTNLTELINDKFFMGPS